MLSGLGIRSSLIVAEARSTTVKTRFIAGQQQMLRVDEETTQGPRTVRQEALQRMRDFINDYDVVLLSDYKKGVLCLEIILNSAVKLARAHGKRVFVDPKGVDFTCYQSASVLTPQFARTARSDTFTGRR